MLRKLKHKQVLFIVVLTVLMLGLHLDIIPVSIMEARNFTTAREMLTDGNWLLTTMNGEPRYQKPPLPSWINACFAALLGLKNLFALRLPAVLSVALIGVYVYFISIKLTKNKTHSIHNALIVITSFYVIGIVFEAPSDIFTHGFMLVGIYQLLKLFQNNSNYIKLSISAGLFIGFSILSKGPVSFYVLLLPFLLAYGFSFKYTFNKKLVLSFALCLIIALVVGGWWYLYVRIHDPQTFTAIAERETTNWSSYNVRPFYYYWSFFIQSGIWTIPAFMGLLYPYMKSRVSNLKAYKFSFFWTIFAVILLSVIPEKKSRYLMPVLIPLAINTGFYIQYLIKRFAALSNKAETYPVYFNFGLISFLALAFPIGTYVVLGDLLSNVLLYYVLASLASLSIGVLLFLNLKKKNIRAVFYITFLFVFCLLTLALPTVEALKSNTYNPVYNLKASRPNLRIYNLKNIAPETIWQFGEKLPRLKPNETIIFPKETSFGILTDDISPRDLEIIRETYNIEQMETFDLNLSKPDSKSYKSRLKSKFYIVTKR